MTALCMASANTVLRLAYPEILFLCKGTGHGMGMSLFGANEMALEGKNYIEILNYFFQGITLTKVE